MVAAVILPNTSWTPAQPSLASALLDGLTKGPVAFFEPGNPNRPLPWTPGSRTANVPGNGAVIPNLARDPNGVVANLAAATVGSDPGDFVVTSTVSVSSPRMRLERTDRGALHAVSSQVTQDSTYETWRLSLGAACVTYLNANLGHATYLGLWYRQTRAYAAGATTTAQIAGLMMANADGSSGGPNRWVTAGPNSTSSHITTTPAAGDTSGSGGSSRLLGLTVVDDSAASGLVFVGVAATSAPAAFVALDRFLNLGAASAGQQNRYPSLIPYRAYLEDLTQSGKTYTDRVTIDQGEFVAACQTSGGRYAGEAAGVTYTAPTALLP